MHIEPLNIADYDELINLWKRAGLPYDAEERDNRASIERQIFDPVVEILVLRDEDKMIGSVIASSDGRKGWINRLAVDPDYRGRRLAARLLERAEEFLIGKGLTIIAALIEDENFPSMAAFRRAGYEGWDKIVYFRKKLPETE